MRLTHKVPTIQLLPYIPKPISQKTNNKKRYNLQTFSNIVSRVKQYLKMS